MHTSAEALLSRTPTLRSDPDRLVDTPTFAQMVGITPIFAKQLRLRGEGPVYVKLTTGGSVRYRVGDVIDWIESRRRRSTSSTQAA